MSKLRPIKPLADDPIGLVVDGRRRCGASDVRCKNPKAPGRCISTFCNPNGRCGRHGGKVLSGANSPRWKGGRTYVLPARMLDNFTECANDPELLSCQNDIALAEARTNDLLKRVDTGECGAMWSALRDALNEYDDAEDYGDKQRILERVRLLVQDGSADWKSWDEVLKWQDARGRAAERQRKLLVEMQQSLTMPQILALVERLVRIIVMHVPDPVIRDAISVDIGAIMNYNGKPSLGGRTV